MLIVKPERVSLPKMIGPNPRLKALTSLLKWRGASSMVIDKANSFAGRANEVAERRNRFLHDPWLKRKDGSFERLHVTAKGELVFEFKPTTLKDAEDVFTKAISLLRDFEDFRDY